MSVAIIPTHSMDATEFLTIIRGFTVAFPSAEDTLVSYAAKTLPHRSFLLPWESRDILALFIFLEQTK